MSQQNQRTTSASGSRATRIGGITVLTTAILLVLLIIINAICLALPVDVTMFDTSGLGLTQISDKSKAFLKDVTLDVTVYWLCEGGEMDETLGLMAAGYEEECPRIDVVMVDPLSNPTFTAKYTDSELSNHSFIVESKLRSTVVDASDFYYYTNDFVDQQLNGGNTYKMTQDEYLSIYEAYGTYMDSTASYAFFQGEALLTSAVDYVTMPTLPKTYVLTGHGDTALSEIMMAALDVYQVAPQKLNLLSADAIPDDASCIIIYDPKSDLSPREVELLTAYVKNGGSLVLSTNPTSATFENIAAVTAVFGLSANEGLLMDPTDNYYKSEKHLLVPLVNTNISPLSSLYSMGYLAYTPTAHGINVPKELPSGVSAAPLLATSDKAYRISVDGEATTLCDPATQYPAALAILSGASSDGTTNDGKLVWFASTEAFTESAAAAYSGSNYYYFAMMTRYVTDLYASPYTAIEGVNLTAPVLESMTTDTALVLGAVMVAVIPLTLLVSGLVIWLKRRNR